MGEVERKRERKRESEREKEREREKEQKSTHDEASNTITDAPSEPPMSFAAALRNAVQPIFQCPVEGMRTSHETRKKAECIYSWTIVRG